MSVRINDATVKMILGSNIKDFINKDILIDIKQTKEYEGFAFKNNLHNIDALRELREVMKAVKKVFRYNSIEDIADTYRISLSGISPNLFFNLKQSPHECKN